MKLQIKVVPGSSKDNVEWLGNLLKVKVRAQPEKGKANAAVEALLAARLQLPADSVRIVAGFGSPLKTVEIHLPDEATLRAKLLQTD